MFRAPFVPTFSKPFPQDTVAAVIPWWLSGGIAAVNCVAAYQPKGAASLAASYVNLANPGTYNAAPGVAPTWGIVNGWDFSPNKYLTCGIIPSATNWSALCKFSGLTEPNNTVFGAFSDGTHAFLIQPKVAFTLRDIYNGGTLRLTAVISGVVGFSDRKSYLDGYADAGSIGSGGLPSIAVFIGALNYLSGTAVQSIKYMQAISFYNTPLPAQQMLAVTNAMNLL